MAFLPSWLNPFDIFIVLGLFAGIALGFIRGLVRMALNLLVLYIAIVLAMTFYDELGYRFGLVAGGAMPQSITEAIAFAVILILAVVILNLVLRRTYRDTELPGIRQIDQLGGMVVGFILICTWIGLAIVTVGFLLSASDIAEGTVRANLLVYFNTSNLIPIFYEFLPIALFTLRPWMPKGLPPDIFSRRFF
jgi:membrane protein required for colicin V production